VFGKTRSTIYRILQRSNYILARFGILLNSTITLEWYKTNKVDFINEKYRKYQKHQFAKLSPGQTNQAILGNHEVTIEDN
jgi:hypothetical protein